MSEASLPDAARAITEQAQRLLREADRYSEVYAELDLGYDFVDRYEERGDDRLSFEGMIRVTLLWKAEKISQAETARHLQEYPVYWIQFGLERAPTQQTISRAWRRRFTERLRAVIDAVAEGMREAAHEQKNYTHKLPEPAGDEEDPTDEFTDKQIERTVKLALDLTAEPFDSGRAENAKYDDDLFIEAQSYLGMDQSGTPQLESRFERHSNREETHSGDTHLWAVKQFGTPEGWEPDETQTEQPPKGLAPTPDHTEVRGALTPSFDAAVGNIIDALPEGHFDSRETVVAIDSTPLPYYGDRAGMEMVNSSRDETDDAAYEMGTITIATEGTAPIILGKLGWRRDAAWKDGPSGRRVTVVRRLIQKAQQYVDIDLLLADRLFDVRAVQSLVDRMGIDYLMPKEQNTSETAHIRRMKRAGDRVDVEHDRGFPLDDGSFYRTNVLYVPSNRANGDIVTFITNRDVAEPEAIGFVRRYRRRWTIENQYKSIKERFLGHTSSKDYRVRLFYFMFGVLLYNIWQLTSALLLAERDDPATDDHEAVIDAAELVDRVSRHLRSFG